MQKDAKSYLFLLFLIVGFIFIPALVAKINGQVMSLPLAFGQVIERLAPTRESPNEAVFVGDVMLARDVERKLQSTPGLYPFAATEELFNGRYVIGNFEAAIPEVHQPTPDFNFRFSVDPKHLDTLVKARFTHWSLANNHSFDFGEAGFAETVDQLRLRNFTVFGSPQISSTTTMTSLVVNQQKVVLFGLNVTAALPDNDQLSQMIKEADRKNDLVVIYIHWGDEYESVHNKTQERLAHQLIESGADLIVGHHPHVVQDIELYQGRLIIYSLGNFLFDQYFSSEVQTGLAIILRPEPSRLLVTLEPVSSETTKVVPQLLKDESKQQWLNDLAERSLPELKEAIISGRISLDI